MCTQIIVLLFYQCVLEFKTTDWWPGMILKFLSLQHVLSWKSKAALDHHMTSFDYHFDHRFLKSGHLFSLAVIGWEETRLWKSSRWLLANVRRAFVFSWSFGLFDQVLLSSFYVMNITPNWGMCKDLNYLSFVTSRHKIPHPSMFSPFVDNGS